MDASWPGLAAAVRTGGIGALGNAMSATFASLRADEKLFLFGPAAMFWLCCSFWASVVACFPRHAKARWEGGA